jgi:hypothetical protein
MHHTAIRYFDELRAILRPWLGEVRNLNLPSNPSDICVFMNDIVGRGFRALVWEKNDADPDWIRPHWRRASGVTCPRCRTEIQAFLKSHRVDHSTRADAPQIFCKCIRLKPSRLPSLEFFTNNWATVLEAVSFFERVATELHAQNQLERDAYGVRIAGSASTTIQPEHENHANV